MRAILVHGWEGYPEEGWKPWLKRELELRGFEILVPAMPDANTPTMEKWVSYLTEIVGAPDKKTFLVGHSLGCIAILRYLETLKEGQKIGGAILVAGFGEDLDYKAYKGELSSFFKTTPDWEKIRDHCKQFVAVHSTDDPWVSIKNNKLFQEKLNAKSVIQHNMKHYSGDDGVTELPVVLEELLRMQAEIKLELLTLLSNK